MDSSSWSRSSAGPCRPAKSLISPVRRSLQAIPALQEAQAEVLELTQLPTGRPLADNRSVSAVRRRMARTECRYHTLLSSARWAYKIGREYACVHRGRQRPTASLPTIQRRWFMTALYRQRAGHGPRRLRQRGLKSANLFVPAAYRYSGKGRARPTLPSPA